MTRVNWSIIISRPARGESGRPWLSILVLSGLLIVLGVAAPTGAETVEQGETSPSLVKAGFITKFPRFVTWPDSFWAPGADKFVVGTIGETPVQAELEKLAALKPILGSRLEIQRLDDPENPHLIRGLDSAQIVFVAGSESSRLEELLALWEGRPILTVADTPGFAKRGVHLNFYIEDNRVRFELNRRACEATGLDLSFRLRNVARLVE